MSSSVAKTDFSSSCCSKGRNAGYVNSVPRSSCGLSSTVNGFAKGLGTYDSPFSSHSKSCLSSIELSSRLYFTRRVINFWRVLFLGQMSSTNQLRADVIPTLKNRDTSVALPLPDTKPALSHKTWKRSENLLLGIFFNISQNRTALKGWLLSHNTFDTKSNYKLTNRTTSWLRPQLCLTT